MENSIRINAIVDISFSAIEAIVENSKKIVGKDSKGHYRVDTAEMAGAMISKFLFENNFEDYVKNIDNYPEINQK